MSDQDQDKGSARKVLDVADLLAGYAVTGAANTDLAKHLGVNPSAITRAMAVLIDKGWARKDATSGLFHPTPKMGQVFGRVLADLSRAEQDLADVRHNFTRI